MPLQRPVVNKLNGQFSVRIKIAYLCNVSVPVNLAGSFKASMLDIFHLCPEKNAEVSNITFLRHKLEQLASRTGSAGLGWTQLCCDPRHL